MILEELPYDVQAELSDPEYIDCRHFSSRTYEKGCKGPLCRMRERLDRRKRYAKARGEKYNPSPDTRKSQRDEELLLIAKQHLVEWNEQQTLAIFEDLSA